MCCIFTASSMSTGTVVSVCPICGSPEVVHLCSAYLEAKTVIDRAKMEAKKDSEKTNEEQEVTGLGSQSSDKQAVMDSSVSDSGNTGENEEVSEDFPKYVVIYLGSAYLDRRFPPQTAMPWVMGEVKRSRDTFKEVQLQIQKSTLTAVAYEGTEHIDTLFEHNLHTLSRFAKTHQDPRCFAYLRRQSLYSDYECHVFLAHDESVVSCFLLNCLFQMLGNIYCLQYLAKL